MIAVKVVYDPRYRTATIHTARGFTQLTDREEWQAQQLARMLDAEYKVWGDA